MIKRCIRLKLKNIMKLTYKIIYYYNFGLWLLKIIPNFIEKIFLEKDELIIFIKKKNLKNILIFFKEHSLIKFNILIDITAVDYLNKKKRFEVNYFLLSIFLNMRLRIKIFTDEITPISSIISIYNSANWYERETWDMYGIFFYNHPDLRRLLTDYGFEGFPFRKDFPQSGYIEIQYDDTKKYIVYKPLKNIQEYRSFNFTNSWLYNI